MNKNKRALISMIVFLSVFCLSAFIYIPIPLTTAEEAAEADTMQNIQSDQSATTEDKNEIESFSYESGSSLTLWEASSMATVNTAEAIDIQEDHVSEDNSGTDTKELKESEVTLTALPENSSNEETTNTVDTSTAMAEEAEPKEALYSNIGISIAKDFVNIRKEASTDSDILGKLYRDSAAEIIEVKGDWYLIESGSVKGYVNAEFIKTGISDEELVDKYGKLSIIVTVDGLNVRDTTDTESAKLDVIYKNEIYPVLDTNEEWIKIKIPDDNINGFIKREFADIIVDFKDAVSKEEEEELLQLQAEERAKKETEVKQQDGVSYSQEDLMLLACLVHAEAGSQSYEGKLAVANVVLNRVKSSKYPDSIEAVIYQPGQFSVAKSGSLAKQLANFEYYSSSSQRLSIKAAKAALGGANNIGSRLYFHSYRAAVNKGYDKKDSSVKLDDQLFW